MLKIGLVSLVALFAWLCYATARYCVPGSPKGAAIGSVLRLSGC